MKTNETDQNVKKSLFLLALINAYDAKKFSIHGVECNKAGQKTPLKTSYLVLEKFAD